MTIKGGHTKQQKFTCKATEKAETVVIDTTATGERTGKMKVLLITAMVIVAVSAWASKDEGNYPSCENIPTHEITS